MERHRAPAARYPFVRAPPRPDRTWRSTRGRVAVATAVADEDKDKDRDGGRARMARVPKPPAVRRATVGKMWEPRLKSQRMEGREREAGWDWRMGTSKRLRVAMPPAARREREMEEAWRIVVMVDIVTGGSWVGFVEALEFWNVDSSCLSLWS